MKVIIFHDFSVYQVSSIIKNLILFIKQESKTLLVTLLVAILLLNLV